MKIKNFDFYAGLVTVRPEDSKKFWVDVHDVKLAELIGNIDDATSASDILDCIDVEAIVDYLHGKGYRFVETKDEH